MSTTAPTLTWSMRTYQPHPCNCKRLNGIDLHSLHLNITCNYGCMRQIKPFRMRFLPQPRVFLRAFVLRFLPEAERRGLLLNQTGSPLVAEEWGVSLPLFAVSLWSTRAAGVFTPPFAQSCYPVCVGESKNGRH